MKKAGLSFSVLDLTLDGAEMFLDPGRLESLGWKGFSDISDRVDRVLRSGVDSFLDIDSYRRILRELEGLGRASPISRSTKLVEGLDLWSEPCDPGYWRALLDRCLSRIERERPEVVGFSIQEYQHYAAVWLAKRVRDRVDGVLTVAGGFNPSMFPEGYASIFDVVVRGEAEECFPDLALRLEESRDFGDVANLTYMNGDGRLRTTPSEVPDPRVLPRPDFSQFPFDRYFSPQLTLPILATRGCWWGRCTFCSHWASYRGSFRQRPVGDVVDEMEQHSDLYNCAIFTFNDESLPGRYGLKLADEIAGRGLSCTWSSYARFEDGMDTKFMDTLHRSGCRLLMWGLESGSERVLDLMDKGIKPRQAARVLRNADRAGIANHVFLIAGFPGEREEDLERTRIFINQNIANISLTGCSHFRAMKGSLIADRPRRYGIELVGRPRFSRIYLYEQNEEALTEQQIQNGIKDLQGRGKLSFLTSPRLANDTRSHLLIFLANGIQSLNP